jgi:hypothetical protein
VPPFRGRRTGDLDRGAVREHDPSADQLAGGLARGQPGGECAKRGHQRVPGDPERSPSAHRMPDEDKGYLPVSGRDLLQQVS